MKRRINSSGVASRLRAVRREYKLEVLEMATELGLGANAYRKYERGIYIPSHSVQALLAEKFGISLDWLFFNKGAMHISAVETALRENEEFKKAAQQEAEELKKAEQQEQEKINQENTRETVVPPDAMVVTRPEIKELLEYMDENPVFKFQLLSHFYQHRQGEVKDKKSPFK